jgi:hypothetical protein
MMRHDQDSFVAKNFLGPLSQQYLSLTGTIAQLYLVRMLQRKKPRLRGRDAEERGGLELEHGRIATIFPSLVPHLQ